jgi:hypothetical protein
MKRLLVSVCILGFPGSALAVDQSPQQIAQRICDQWTQKWNAKEQIPPSLETADAIEVSPQGPVKGQEALKKAYEDTYKVATNFHCTVDKTEGGNNQLLWATGAYGFTLQTANSKVPVEGFWGAVYSGQGDDTKVKMLTYNTTPPPAKQ